MTRVIVAGNDPDIKEALENSGVVIEGDTDNVSGEEYRRESVPVLEPYMRIFSDYGQMFNLTDTAVPSGGMASFGMKYIHSRKARARRRK